MFVLFGKISRGGNPFDYNLFVDSFLILSSNKMGEANIEMALNLHYILTSLS